MKICSRTRFKSLDVDKEELLERQADSRDWRRCKIIACLSFLFTCFGLGLFFLSNVVLEDELPGLLGYVSLGVGRLFFFFCSIYF